jgi:hypothetical protein
MSNNKNKKIILSFILIVFYSLSTFAQFDQGWKADSTVDANPNDTNPGNPIEIADAIYTNPGSPSDTADPVATPIDDNLLALLVLGLGLGVFIIQSKKDKITHKIE